MKKSCLLYSVFSHPTDIARYTKQLCQIGLFGWFSIFAIVPAYAIPLDATGGAHVFYNAAPFSKDGRYQQLYSSDLFGRRPGHITSLSFAPQIFPNASIDSTAYTADIVLKLSATKTNFSDWSGVFDDNITFPQTTVIDQIDFTQTIVNGSPNDFSFLLDFSSNPFFYVPGKGNFLIDLTLSNVSYDPNARSVGMSRSDVNGPLARAFENADNSGFGFVGLRTIIGFTPVGAPDPSTLALQSTGVLFGGTQSAYVVPIPPAVYLFGSGLLGLIGIARKRGCNRN